MLTPIMVPAGNSGDIGTVISPLQNGDIGISTKIDHIFFLRPKFWHFGGFTDSIKAIYELIQLYQFGPNRHESSLNIP